MAKRMAKRTATRIVGRMVARAPARNRPTAKLRTPVNDRSIAEFRRTVLRWYETHKRDLPWRRTADPYRIWVSEIMLQQTRVAAVLPHYKDFLERFPTVEALASATEGDVLSAWSGLGYYRRARMLHRGAIEVTQNRGGRVPGNYVGLLDLPGIGRYTAAAIASIAFSEAVAVVDGNVERVAGRVSGCEMSAKETLQWAQKHLAVAQPGNFNQAMMELGATVCTPRSPNCSGCPVRKWCATRGEPPRRGGRLRKQKKELWCLLEERECAGDVLGNVPGDVLLGGDGTRMREVRLVQRASTQSLMPGMWEFPLSSQAPPLPYAAWRTFRHCITVTDYTVHVLRGHVLQDSDGTGKQKTFDELQGSWVASDSIPLMPLTGLTRKILRAGGII